MPDHLAVTVPLSHIRSVQIYLNSPRKSLAAIKKATGADYILNGTLYNMGTGAVNCHLKADGRVIARPAYQVMGYAWDRGPEIAMETLPADERRNYIACTPLIVDGKKLDKLPYATGQGGKRGRSAIGLKGDRLALYCTRDRGTMTRTPEKLRDDLEEAGWDSAVMLDGGGSSQCDFAGKKITSTRKVQHLILVYLKKAEGDPAGAQQSGSGGERTNNGTKQDLAAGGGGQSGVCEDEPEGEKPMVEIHAYSKQRDGGRKLSANFTVKEFASGDGADAVLVAPRLVMVLQSIRSYFGKPTTITSGYRTPQHNEKVGGAAHSQHCCGTAADISVKGVTPAQVAAYAREIMPDWGGVGLYSTFTHIDVREEKADWKG